VLFVGSAVQQLQDIFGGCGEVYAACNCAKGKPSLSS